MDATVSIRLMMAHQEKWQYDRRHDGVNGHIHSYVDISCGNIKQLSQHRPVNILSLALLDVTNKTDQDDQCQRNKIKYVQHGQPQVAIERTRHPKLIVMASNRMRHN